MMEGLGAFGITEDKLEMLKNFVQLCKFNSSILHAPQLKFMKDWLEQDLNCTIPEIKKPSENGDGSKSYAKAASEGSTAWAKNDDDDDEESSAESSSSEESDLDLDMEGVIPGDTDPPQEMGADGKEPTEEEQEQAMKMRQLGMEALSNGDNEGAVKHFTAGILLDNTRTVLFVKRATAYLRLGKPNACIRDARKALNINPDSAAAYKTLGKAERLLGNWDEACHNFEVAQKIDYDDDIHDLLREIKPKGTKIREHRMARERKQKEKEVKERLNRVRKAQKAQEKARKEQAKRDKEAEEKFRQQMPNMFNFAGEAPMPGADDAVPDEKANDDGEPKIFEVPDDIDLD
ncbi:putative protein FAM10A4 [Clavelina lepadiformis]|uniref:putative protein FAM10A4 n=1 Tax=Clavelina lepadiformis TaxID=159417 RepID=UPI0040411553